MSVSVRRMRCEPDEVWRVLGDGWLLAGWVVGASRMRNVDAEWPSSGSRVHHSFGVWPLVIDDSTRIVDDARPRSLTMRPSGRWLGTAEVRLEVRATAEGCVVRMHERAVTGPGRLVPPPVLDLVLRVRNREALRRLAWLAERR